MTTLATDRTYADVVRRALGETFTEDHLRVAEHLEGLAGPDGRFPKAEMDAGRISAALSIDEGKVHNVGKDLARVKVLCKYSDGDFLLRLPSFDLAPQGRRIVPDPLSDVGTMSRDSVASTGPRSLGSPPATPAKTRPKTRYRDPVDQAEHRRAVRDILRGQGITRAVALEAHDQIGMTFAGSQAPFSEIKRELAAGYLAGFTGFSETKIRRAMNEAVEAGLFLRIDNGAGGKGNTNRATYRAIIPEYWTDPARAIPSTSYHV